MSLSVDPQMDDPVATIRALYAEQRFAETAAFIRAVNAHPAKRGDDWRLIANAAMALTDRYAAAQAARCWVEESPESIEAHIFCADQLANSGAIAEALQFSAAMCEKFPDSAHISFTAGGIEAQAGLLKPALAHLRKAWDLDGEFTGAWERIARIKRFQDADRDLSIVYSLPQKAASLGPNFQISAHYACADVYDQLGYPHRAFPHYEQAAKLVKQTAPYDMDHQLSIIKNGMDAFDDDFLAGFKGVGDPSRQPIFIVGPPRSGTTLVEQVLASHSRVAGGGETSALRVASWPLKNFTPDALAAFSPAGDGAPWRDMGQKYLSLTAEMFGDHPHITNKDIGSIASIGLIRLILPNARIIFCDRNPMDAGWSCYKAHFSGSIPWSFDFHDIAKYFAAFRFAREEWRRRLPDNILDVRYEEFVSNPKPQIDRLLNFCDLPVEQSCYDFHKTVRQISTASITQVRRPAYTSSIDAWRKYEEFLKPLQDAMIRYALI